MALTWRASARPWTASAAGRWPRASTRGADAAKQHDLTLLHYDSDFDAIAKVTGQACQLIVAAGTLD